MVRSHTSVEHAPPLNEIHGRAWRLELRRLAETRLISNLLALVALISIGFV